MIPSFQSQSLLRFQSQNFIYLSALIATLLFVLGPYASKSNPPESSSAPPSTSFTFNEIFGTFDRGEIQRGLQVFKNVCSTCHGLEKVRFGKLKNLGFTEAQVKAFAKSFEVAGPEDEEGNTTRRPADLSDPIPSPYANKNAARAANKGALPPDLSLMAKARPDGPSYIKALLLGYKDLPATFHLLPGMSYNVYFPGHQIAMPPPLSDHLVEYTDGTIPTIKQMAHDVTVFLAWAAEPELEERKQMGLKVLLFLGIFAILMFIVNRRTWEKCP